MIENDHWWWNVPEFVQAQQEPGFRAWVETIELGIELGEITFTDIIPDLPSDMFSDEAITIAERALLRRYPDTLALKDDPDKGWAYMKYLGQAYVEKLECRWVYQPKVKGKWEIEGPAIERPWPDNMLLPVLPLVGGAVGCQSGEEWLWVFNNNRKSYLEWKAQGSPKSWDWP
ncbi:hypothetical protein BKG80_10920 [Mycobacteroides chelonae]|uniref:hypothetical protein n=1 Tax=Mycobacteroides chelonae TaxID=1774 RepID=UPI0008A9BB70|nr:hypothetical protein [Mycobacteroides chelonae]OHU38289.1 hypothetical protein BKG80_10920 [Mycobacteroides chelonae]